MPMLNPWEIIIILIILVVIFGASRLSQFGGALGKSVREFRHAVQEEPSQTQPQPSTPVALPAAETVEVRPQLACPSCQALNPDTQKFCGKCGTRLINPVAAAPAPAPAAENTCPSCATVNPTGQVFCGQCGARLTRAA